MNIQLKEITNIIKMGRKKRITKEIKECTHSDSDDSNIIVTKEDTDKNLDVIWNTRLEMINYCDEMSIPLCDYLNQDIMENFVKFLSES